MTWEKIVFGVHGICVSKTTTYLQKHVSIIIYDPCALLNLQRTLLITNLSSTRQKQTTHSTFVFKRWRSYTIHEVLFLNNL